MFIYKAEKEEMQRSITFLLGEFSKVWGEHLVLKAKIKVLEGKQVATKKPKKILTAAQKVKQREYQRAYQARRKAQKLTEGTTNVSA